jgi:hypothetical protein
MTETMRAVVLDTPGPLAGPTFAEWLARERSAAAR